MKKIISFFLFIIPPSSFAVGNQGTGYIVPQGTTVRINEHGTCKKVNNGSASYHFFIGAKAASEWSSFVTNPPAGMSLSNCDATFRSCLDIKKANPSATSGKYTIDVDGVGVGYPAIDTYCDMTTDGGGWTLVWSNTRTGTNKPSRNMVWTEATQTLPRCSQAQGSGTGCENFLGNNKEGFNYFIGIDWWSRITGQKKNSEFMYQWSSNYGQPIEQMSKFNIRRTNDSRLFLVDASNLSLLLGSYTPGIYSFHFANKLVLATKDNDSGSCANGFDGSPYWYAGCWNGSLIGGSEIEHLSYLNGAYYLGSEKYWGVSTGTGAGNGWFFIREYDYLSNCTEIKSKFPLSPSGKYWIDPDGSGGNPPFLAKCDMTIDGGGWTLVMNQKTDTGGFFADATQAELHNLNNPDADLYSVLSRIEGFRSIQGNFTFKINWPGYPQRNIWRQRTNPFVDQPVAGYVPLQIDSSSDVWGGLERNCAINCTSSFIDGSVNHSNWYYAIASYAAYFGSGIPSSTAIIPTDNGVNQTQLWVRDDSFLLREPRDCQEIMEFGLSTGDGLYWVDPAMSGSSTQVYCDMTTDGGGWTLVFNHNIAGGYFSNATDSLSKNISSPTSNLYSILDRLDDFKANQRYIFRINWPGEISRNIWMQKTNPTIDQAVAGYVPLSIDQSDKSWGGLERNCSVGCTSSLMDGSVNNGWWHYAIGAFGSYLGGIPSYSDTAGATHVQLWTRRAEGHFTKRSCKEIRDAGLSVGDGLYYIDPDGVGGELPFRVYCDMTTSGGGWTRVAYSNGSVTTTNVPSNFFVSTVNKSFIGRVGVANMAASINTEWFSRLIGTTDAMFKAPSYAGSPFIDVGMGEWNYDVPRCTGTLLHTARTSGCPGPGGNDNYDTADRFNLSFNNGSSAIVPNYFNSGNELCYSGRGNCAFEFFLR